jgi:hypothetical protein
MLEQIINCIECGKPLQIVFAEISSSFTGGLFVQKDGMGSWMVCTNPQCPDGKHNVNNGATEAEL